MAPKSLPRLDGAADALLGQVEGTKGGPLPPEAWRPLEGAERPGVCAAVDGGQAVVADLGSCGVVALRAGWVLRDEADRYEDRVPYNDVHVVARERADATWQACVRAHEWGLDLSPPRASGAGWVRGWLEALRSVAEYDSARRALRLLREGDLLLLDGSLDPNPSHPGMVESLARAARAAGVHTVGVTKDTTLSFRGVLPFTLELEEAAVDGGSPPAFAVDVTGVLGRDRPFAVYGVRFDARSPVYRVDVAAADAPAEAVLSRVAALCNDVATPGYPYPLARAHERVHFAAHESGDLRRALESLVARHKGSWFSLRLFRRGREGLALAE